MVGAAVRGRSNINSDGSKSSAGAAVAPIPVAEGVPTNVGGIVGEGVGSEVGCPPPVVVGSTGAGAAVRGSAKTEGGCSSTGAVVNGVEAVVGEGVGSSLADAGEGLVPGPVA